MKIYLNDYLHTYHLTKHNMSTAIVSNTATAHNGEYTYNHLDCCSTVFKIIYFLVIYYFFEIFLHACDT